MDWSGLSTRLILAAFVFCYCPVQISSQPNTTTTLPYKQNFKARVNLLFLTSLPAYILQQKTFQQHLNFSVADKPRNPTQAVFGNVASPASIPWLGNEQLDFVEVYALIRDTGYGEHSNLQRSLSVVWSELDNSTTSVVGFCTPNSDHNTSETTHPPTSAPGAFHMILGPNYSSEVKTIAQLTSLFNLVVMSSAATSPTLNDRSQYPYFFRTCPNDGDAPNVLARLIKSFGYDQLTILYTYKPFIVDMIFSQTYTQLREVLEAEFRNHSIGIESSLFFDVHDFATLTYAANVLSTARSHVWVLVIASNQYPLMCAMIKTGKISGATHLAFTYTAVDNKEQWWLPPDNRYEENCTVDQVLSLLRGSMLVTWTDFELLDTPADIVGLKPSQFHRDMDKAAEEEQKNTSFRTYLFNQFDAITAAALALDRAERKLQEKFNSSLAYFRYNDSRALEAVYEQLTNLSFEGLTGRVQFEHDGDRSGISLTIKQFQGEAYVDVGATANYSESATNTYNITILKSLKFTTSDNRAPPQFLITFTTSSIILICIVAAIVLIVVAGIAYYFEKHRIKRLSLLSAMQNIDRLVIDQKDLMAVENLSESGKLLKSVLSSGFSQTSSTFSLQSSTTTSTSYAGPQQSLPFLPFLYDGSPVCLFPYNLDDNRVGIISKQVSTPTGFVDLEFVRSVSAVLACSKHDNLASLIGLVRMTYSNELHRSYMVMSGGNKGTLYDFLALSKSNGEVLEDVCRFVFLKDLQAGLVAVHKRFGFHARLSSVVCLVDSRLSLCINDYGMVPHRRAFFGEAAENYSNFLWSAPELIEVLLSGNKEELRASGNRPFVSVVWEQQCDVYSFGVIATEVFSKLPPFGSLTELSNEVQRNANYSMLKSFEREPNKPESLVAQTLEQTGHGIGSNSFDVYSMCKRCVAGNAALRPSAAEIGAAVQAMFKSRKFSGNLTDMLLKRLETYATNLESVVEQRTQALREEENKVRRLLYQILPQTVAEELKNGNSVPPQTYDRVTIFFSDIVDFTTIAAESTPLQVVDLLNDLYGTFDQITSQFDVYKVETIGDSYMVVSGLPKPNGLDHVWHIVRMSLALVAYVVDTFKIRHRPDDQLLLRVGLHTGPCAAGVVGFIMPRYCLFGDTVNTASRMESTGEALRIHASDATALTLEKLAEYYGGTNCDKAYQFAVKERGELDIKGKGRMRTFWVTKQTEENF